MSARTVHVGDGVAWLRANPLPPDHALVTSLPDASEMPGLSIEAWERWFIDAAALACAQVGEGAVAIFYQTDIKHEGRWIDKSALVTRGADAAGSTLLWRKVVCRVPPGRSRSAVRGTPTCSATAGASA